MSKKDRNQSRLNEKHKLFLFHYYGEGKTLAESYNLSHNCSLPESTSSQRGYQVKRFLESFEDFRSIIRQFSPLPTLGAHMSDIAFNSKDPNLRHKGQKLVAQCLGLLEPDEGQQGGGIAINIISGKTAVQVNAGDGPREADTPEQAQIKKDGKPISFIK